MPERCWLAELKGGLQRQKYGADTLAKMTKVRDVLTSSPQFLLGQKISLASEKGGKLYKPRDALKLIDETIEMVKNGKPGDITYMLNRTKILTRKAVILNYLKKLLEI